MLTDTVFIMFSSAKIKYLSVKMYKIKLNTSHHHKYFKSKQTLETVPKTCSHSQGDDTHCHNEQQTNKVRGF